VNEQVESALAFTPAAKAQVHVALAQKRLEEAQALALKGELTATTTAQLQQNLDEHAAQAQALTQTVAQADPSEAAELSTQLTSSLAANDAILQDVADHSKDENTRLESLRLSAAIRTQLFSTARLFDGDAGRQGSTTLATSSVSGDASTTPSSTQDAKAAVFLGKRAAAELSTVANQLSDMHASIDASVATSVALQLASLQQTLQAGNTALTKGDSTQATEDFTHVYAASVRLETLLRASKRLGSHLLDPLLQNVQNSTTTATSSDERATSSSSDEHNGGFLQGLLEQVKSDSND
jgi:hypothetical protein